MVDLEVDGRNYEGARISSVRPGAVSVMHSGGAASIPIGQLKPEDIARLNQTNERVKIPANWKEHYKTWIDQQELIRKAQAERAAAARAEREQREMRAPGLPPVPEDSPVSSTNPAPGAASSAEEAAPVSTASVADARLKLNPSWNEPFGGKPHAIDDLKTIFKPIARGRLDSGPHPDLELVRGVPYLMTALEAAKTLELGEVVSNSLVNTPGFPARTIGLLGFDGNFGGGFNRIFLVTDAAKQVIAVQFVNESPGAIDRGPGNGLALVSLGNVIVSTGGVRVFNYNQNRRKGSTSSSVQLTIRPVLGLSAGVAAVPGSPLLPGSGRSAPSAGGGRPTLYAVDSVFRDGTGTGEIVRWLVPQPIVDLIYHCSTMPGVGTGLSTGGLSTGGL